MIVSSGRVILMKMITWYLIYYSGDDGTGGVQPVVRVFSVDGIMVIWWQYWWCADDNGSNDDDNVVTSDQDATGGNSSGNEVRFALN